MPPTRPIQKNLLTTTIVAVLTALCIVHTSHAQWQQLNGPFGGDASGMVIVDNNVFTRNREHLFRSTDQGATWKEIGRGQLGVPLGAMAGLGNRVYVSCGDSLCVSTDGGDTWRRLNMKFDRMSSLSVIGSTLIAACYYDLLTSTDLGESWTSIRDQAPFKYPFMTTQSGDHLFLLRNRSYHVSIDTGRTWTPIADSAQREYTTFLVEGDRFLAGSNHGVHVSTDRGQSWTRIGNALRSETIVQLARIGSYVFAVSKNGVFRSSTNGESWEDVLVPFGNGQATAIIDAGNRLLVSHSSDGIYASTDAGTSWTRSNNGLIAATVNGIVVYRNRLFAACGPRGFYVSDDLGATWEEVESFRGVDVTCLADAGKSIVAGTSKGWYRSADTGRTWQRDEDSYTSDREIYAIAYDNGQLAMISFYAQCAVFTTTDDGATWKFSSGTRLPSAPTSHATYNTIHSVFINSGVIYAITDGGLSISEDRGQNWRTDDANMPEGEVPYIFTAVAAHGSNVVVSGWDDRQYRSTDVGRTWTVWHHIPDPYIRSFLRYGTGFIAVSPTLRYVEEANTTWIDISDGLQTAYTGQAILHDNYLYACGSGDGIWRRPLETIVHVKEDEDQLGGSIALWPTPTSTQATVTFTTSTSGNAVITFVDPLGRHVLSSTTHLLSGGEHHVNINTASLAGGWYTVVITTDDQVLVGRCIVESAGR